MKKWILLCAGWIRENKEIFIALMVCVFSPLFFLDRFHEFFTLILSMYGNEYVGIAAWIAAQKPIWQTAVTTAFVTNVGLILIYLGLDLGKLISSEIRGFATKKGLNKWVLFKMIGSLRGELSKWILFKILGSLIRKIREKAKRNKITVWLSKQSLIVAYCLCFVPVIPGAIPLTIILAKIRGQKHGLWVLLAVNSVRGSLLAWGIYTGALYVMFNFFGYTPN